MVSALSAELAGELAREEAGEDVGEDVAAGAAAAAPMPMESLPPSGEGGGLRGCSKKTRLLSGALWVWGLR